MKICSDCWIMLNESNAYKNHLWNLLKRCKKCNNKFAYESKLKKHWKKKLNIIHKNNKLIRKQNWLCVSCNNVAWCGIYCEEHYIKNKLKNHKLSHLWISWYKTLFDKQKWLCFYTWERLIIWFNDSIDHILPISKWWENIESNIVICTTDFNKIKNNHSLEFLYNTVKKFCIKYESNIVRTL